MAYALSSTSEHLSVGATSAGFTTPMKAGSIYQFTANVDCWVKVGATGASAGASADGNILCLAGQVVTLASPAAFPGDTSTTLGYVKAIRDGATDGVATLTEMIRRGRLMEIADAKRENEAAR